jgi:hypothetical protein
MFPRSDDGLIVAGSEVAGNQITQSVAQATIGLQRIHSLRFQDRHFEAIHIAKFCDAHSCARIGIEAQPQFHAQLVEQLWNIINHIIRTLSCRAR